MAISIELSPEIESNLAALAQQQGLSLSVYLSRLLTAQVSVNGNHAESPARRAQMWRDAAKDLPDTPTLCDEAMSRESIYASRG